MCTCALEGATVIMQGLSSSSAGVVVVCVDMDWGTASADNYLQYIPWSEVLCRSLVFSDTFVIHVT